VLSRNRRHTESRETRRDKGEDSLKDGKINRLTVAWSHRDHIMQRGFVVLGFGDWELY
jgi:hypothetical protein